MLSLLYAAIAAWPTIRLGRLVTMLILLLCAGSLLLLLWDFSLHSLSGCLFRNNPTTYYNAGRNAIGYDMSLGIDDAYDWHTSNASMFIFRFEDLYLFFLQLFNIVALYSCTFVWLVLFLDSLSAATAAEVGVTALTAVGLRWLDHALWCLFYSHVAVLLVGSRIWWRVALDVGLSVLLWDRR